MATVRQIVFGVLPDGTAHATYSWPYVEDGNLDSHFFSCAFVPEAKGTRYAGNQDSLFLGTMNAGKTIKTFCRALGQDDSTPVTAEFITNRLDPTLLENQESDAKRFLKATFPYVNPMAKGMSLYYATEAEAPHKNSTTWSSVYWKTPQTRVGFPYGLGRWLHLKGVDATNTVDEPIFSAFGLDYYRLYNRDGEDQ
jgi:hypothetical protein